MNGDPAASPPPPPTSPEDRWEAALVPNYGTPRLLLVRGSGCQVEDAAGRTYVDLLAGIAVNVLGHAHPAVVAAVQKQVARLAHTSNLYANGPSLRLAERLRDLAGGHKTLFLNSGTEANEAALKLCRRHAHATDRAQGVVLAFHGSFHGRTTGALALTGQPHHRTGFDPFPGQVIHVPFNDPGAIEAAFEAHDVVGAFAECIQGEGGVAPMTQEAADTLQKACQGHDALLCIDEVQTGIGRTGRFFAYEHHGLRPDAVTLAKGLGGGMPLGACLVAPRHAGLLGPGSHGCTFGGNAVAAAAGNAVLDVLERDGLIAGAGRLGALLAAELEANSLAWRGRGLLVGVPLDHDGAPKAVQAMEEAGYLVGQAGKRVVRLAPPLTIDGSTLLGAVPALADAVRRAGPLTA